MKTVEIFIESGKKKVFCGAVGWPGWSRGGRDEEGAVEAFLAYGKRYGQVMEGTGLAFKLPGDQMDLNIVERHKGNASTDFGAPAAVLDADQVPTDPEYYPWTKEILSGCWRAFDRAVEGAAGKELRKGPRGGGRDLEKITEHVVEADRQYLRRLAQSHKREKGSRAADELPRIRGAIFEALEAAERGEIPEQGPRGGVIWPVRYFVRRVAWHVLDHAWEIEDRAGI